MWKENFELRIDAHPEDGLMTVCVSHSGDYWRIDGLDSEPVRLPNDDNVLGQIMEVCRAIIDHEDNPLNFHLRAENANKEKIPEGVLWKFHEFNNRD